MAEEGKDEQIIIIEDLEEKKDSQEQEERKQEKPKKKDEESAIKQSTSAYKKKRLILIILSAVIVVTVVLILFFVFSSKKKEKTRPVQHKEKIVEHKKIKKHKIKKKANNVTKKRTSVYNPIVDVHFISAMRLQEKGNYHAAINELKQASVDLYLSYYGIGYIYLKMGDIKKAKEYLINKTKQYLKLTIENNHNYIAGYINLFRVYMADGEYDNAKKVLDILGSKAINNKELSLMKVYYSFVVNKKYDSIEKLTKKYQNSPLLNGLMGDMYMETGALNKARIYLKKALNGYFMGGLYYNRMLAYVEEGKYKEAMNYIPETYYMDFKKIVCKNYLSFFLLLHAHKFKAAYSFLKLNKRYNKNCYSHFKIIPVSKSNITALSLLQRRNVNYMLAAEILNMYLKPVKFSTRGRVNSIKLGNLYESLGLPQKAKISYQSTASFAEAVLLSERAVKFYAAGDLKNALLYYKKALSKVNTSPILLYNVAIMYLKMHNLKASYNIIIQLKNTYPNFPLPYFCMYIIKELSGNHKDALKNIGEFIIKLTSLSGLNKNISKLGFIANFVQNGIVGSNLGLTNETKQVFLLVRAAINDDFTFLNLEKPVINSIGIGINNFSEISVLKYLYKNYPTDFMKRTISDYYLIKKDYEDAYRALFGIVQYSSVDYYKLGIAYLLDGYPNVADNFFTKSILTGDSVYNAYMAKIILQAQKGDLKGVVYYLKLILKKERIWLNTDVYLSFNIDLQS